MGLFDAFRQAGVQRSQITLGPAESFAALMLLVVGSDGYLADSEMRLLNATFNRMKLFRSYSDDVVVRMIDNLCGTLRRDGRSYCQLWTGRQKVRCGERGFLILGR